MVKAGHHRAQQFGTNALKTNEQPSTFKCACSRCKTCLFILNTSKISGPKRSVKITDRFTFTSANVIYCITCTLCNKLYIVETGTRLGDRFREHLRDVEKNDKDASKPVARHFNLPNHSKKYMAICGLSLHLQSWTNFFGTLAFISVKCIFFGLQMPPPSPPLNVGHKLVLFQPCTLFSGYFPQATLNGGGGGSKRTQNM